MWRHKVQRMFREFFFSPTHNFRPSAAGFRRDVLICPHFRFPIASRRDLGKQAYLQRGDSLVGRHSLSSFRPCRPLPLPRLLAFSSAPPSPSLRLCSFAPLPFVRLLDVSLRCLSCDGVLSRNLFLALSASCNVFVCLSLWRCQPANAQTRTFPIPPLSAVWSLRYVWI